MNARDQDCACREAVSRAFDELKNRRMSDGAAFESAVAVFRFHHPEIPPLQAIDTVDRWLTP
ncbi:MAG: hypothetical protein ACPGRZ_09575 [Alphaproteobacteria bacterium]